MDRRTVLTGLSVGVGAAAANATGARLPVGARDCVAISPRYKYSGVDGRSLINRPRAYAVMEELGIDGLVALNPVNVYYLANTIPVMTKFRVDFAGFATFPGDPQQPGFLVAGAPQALEMASGEREVPPLIAITQASNWSEYVNATPAQMRIEPRLELPGSDLRTTNWVGGFAVKDTGPYTTHEQAWIAAQKHSILHSEPTAAWALARALKESGLSRGKLAVDDMRIAALLESVGMTEVTCVPGHKIFQRIRMVKSETELSLQRVGGHNNAVAAMNTIRAIEKGMSFQEIERRFNTETAALGSDAQSFIAGVSLALLPDGITVPKPEAAVPT